MLDLNPASYLTDIRYSHLAHFAKARRYALRQKRPVQNGCSGASPRWRPKIRSELWGQEDRPLGTGRQKGGQEGRQESREASGRQKV